MSRETKHADLLVFEYGGTARSGKGTIVDHLAATYPDVTKDETGLYYRILTKMLMEDGTIDPAMNTAKVLDKIKGYSVEQLVEMLEERDKWTVPDRKPELYENGVHRLVPDVGQFHNARVAVKGGFAARIRSLVAEGNYRAVAIDGRNLSDVVKDIPGARMLLRTFVDCSPYEAALRECTRRNINIESPEGQKFLLDIIERNRKDATREEDPMVLDSNALDYWSGTAVGPSAEQLAEARSTHDYTEIASILGKKFSESSLPSGIGKIAALNGCQVQFDTTAFRLFDEPRTAMLAAADQMFQEALAEA